MFLQKKGEPQKGESERFTDAPEKVIEIIDLSNETRIEQKMEDQHEEINQKSLEEELLQSTKRFLSIKLVIFGKFVKETSNSKVESVLELEKHLNQVLEVLGFTNLSVLSKSIPSLSRIICELCLKILSNKTQEKNNLSTLLDNIKGENFDVFSYFKFIQTSTNALLHHNENIVDVYDIVNIVLAVIKVVFYTVEEIYQRK